MTLTCYLWGEKRWKGDLVEWLVFCVQILWQARLSGAKSWEKTRTHTRTTLLPLSLTHTHTLTFSLPKRNAYRSSAFSHPSGKSSPPSNGRVFHAPPSGHFSTYVALSHSPLVPLKRPLECVCVLDIKNSKAGHASCDAASSTLIKLKNDLVEPVSIVALFSLWNGITR